MASDVSSANTRRGQTTPHCCSRLPPEHSSCSRTGHDPLGQLRVLPSRNYGSSFLFFQKQFLWAVIGVVGFVFFSRFDYRKLKGLGYVAYRRQSSCSWSSCSSRDVGITVGWKLALDRRSARSRSNLPSSPNLR